MAGLKIMDGDGAKTVGNTFIGTAVSFISLHFQEVQAVVVGILTAVYLCYKIKEARAAAKLKEKELEKWNG